MAHLASTTGSVIDQPLAKGGVEFPWSHWQTLLPLVLGAVGLFSFVIYDLFVPAKPLIHLHIFSNLSANISLLGSFMLGLVVSGLLRSLLTIADQRRSGVCASILHPDILPSSP